MRRYAAMLLLCSGSLLPAQQAAKQWVFRDRPYYRPLKSEPRAAQTSVLFPSISDGVPFAANAGRSLAWDLSLGREIPIVGWDSNPAGRDLQDRGVAPGAWGAGIWFPLSFHMLEDMSKDDSNPILNTDYRFAGSMKFQYGLGASAFSGTEGQEGHIGVRYVFWGHESTHIGDEFTLAATRLYGNQFQRVNVSYEYWELGGSFEPNYLDQGKLQMAFRGGFIRLFDQKKGWYSSTLLQPFGQTITPSVRNYEPYFDMEGYYSELFGNWGPFGSLDLRDRTVYGYFRSGPSAPDETQWSANVMAGFRQERESGLIRPSYYLRYYHGVNPAGQFRSQRDYQLFGFGILFDF
jgi:hypothetical protein